MISIEEIKSKFNKWKTERRKKLAERARKREEAWRLERKYPPIFSDWTWQEQMKFEEENKDKIICYNCKYMKIDSDRDRRCISPSLTERSYVSLKLIYPLCRKINDGNCKYYEAEEVGKRWEECSDEIGTWWEKTR